MTNMIKRQSKCTNSIYIFNFVIIRKSTRHKIKYTGIKREKEIA